jgi:hypothetical protein
MPLRGKVVEAQWTCDYLLLSEYHSEAVVSASLRTGSVEGRPYVPQIPSLMCFGRRNHPRLQAYILSGTCALHPQGQRWVSLLAIWTFGWVMAPLSGSLALRVGASFNDTCRYDHRDDEQKYCWQVYEEGPMVERYVPPGLHREA